jgi:hypothetical protein
MDEPDAWWGRVPVFSKRYSIVGEFWDWHKQQLVEAISVISAKYPDALRNIPEKGFQIRVRRSMRKSNNPDKYVHSIAVALCTDCEEFRIVTKVNNTWRPGSVVNFEVFGTDDNSLLTLVEEFARKATDLTPPISEQRKP